MTNDATPEYLIKGYAYALEHCGVLLHDANILYSRRSYASTVVLTTFSIEELGRSTIYIEYWRKLCSGENVAIEEVRKRCKAKNAHIAKQEAGILSITLTGDDDPEFRKWLRIRLEADPQSAASQKAEVVLRRIANDKRSVFQKSAMRNGCQPSMLTENPKMNGTVLS